MSHPNQQWCVLDLLTGVDSQRHHQIGRISGINGIGSNDLSGGPHLISSAISAKVSKSLSKCSMVHSSMNPSPSNTSGPRGASGAKPSRPGRRRPAPGRLMGMRRLTRPRPRRRPRPVRPTSRSARPRDPGRDGAGEGPVATGVPSVSAKGRRAQAVHLPPKLCAATTSHQCRRPGGWLGRSARDGPSAAAPSCRSR